jgi:DNA modification methylase
LIANPKNWRRHPKSQADALRGILREIGFADALLVRELPNGKFMLLDGHLRATTTPDMLVPTLVLDLSEEEADKLLLTLDPLASLAQADLDQVRQLLSSVTTDDEGVRSLLSVIADEYVPDKIELSEDPDPQIDKADELRKKWNTQPGQVWQVGRHRFLCGDCRDREMLARLFEDRQEFTLLWSDPPYGVDYSSKNQFLNRAGRGNRIQRPIENDHLQIADLAALLKDALVNARTHARPGAACYLMAPGGPVLPSMIAAMNAASFMFRASLVWVKQHFVLGRSDYHCRHETILYGWSDDGPHYFVDDRTQDSVFEIDKPSTSDLHPTTKPTELVARMIANSSRIGEIVFDPFCGSGTTLVAAQQTGRVGFGVEIDPGYAAVTLDRLARMGLEPKVVREAQS